MIWKYCEYFVNYFNVPYLIMVWISDKVLAGWSIFSILNVVKYVKLIGRGGKILVLIYISEDKAANNVTMVWKLYLSYIKSFKNELDTTSTYPQLQKKRTTYMYLLYWKTAIVMLFVDLMPWNFVCYFLTHSLAFQ